MDPPYCDGDPTADARDFLNRCHEILCNLGLVESNGIYFTTFEFRGPSK